MGSKNLNSEYHVTIDWVRHGFSCSNAMAPKYIKDGQFGIIPMKLGALISDPVLTDVGVDQAKKLRTFIDRNSYDMVCCSHLRRAAETAIYGFGGTIYVVPFVSEKKSKILDILGIDKENNPGNKMEELDIHMKSVIDQQSDSISLSIINDFTEYDINKENYDMFIQIVLPKIIMKIGKQTIKIAIVSHNNFIKEISDKIDNKNNDMHNTGIKREMFTYIISNGRGNILKRINPNVDGCDSFFCQIYPGEDPKCIKVDRCITYHGHSYPYSRINKEKYFNSCDYYDLYIKEKKKYIEEKQRQMF